MIRYESVYGFAVFSEIQKGTTVYVIDRKNEVVNRCNTLKTNTVADYIAMSEAKSGEITFYKKVEVSENE